MLQEEREFQKDLQHHGGEQRDRERVDGNVLGKVFDEEVQHHEIDEGRSQEAQEPPLLERGVLHRVPHRGAVRGRHSLSPGVDAEVYFTL